MIAGVGAGRGSPHSRRMSTTPTRETLLASIDWTDWAHALAIARNDNRPWLVLVVPEDASDDDAASRLADFILGYSPLKTKEETDRYLRPLLDEGLLICTRDLAADAPRTDDWWLLQTENLIFAACAASDRSRKNGSAETERETELTEDEKEWAAYIRATQSRVPLSAEEFLALGGVVLSDRHAQLCSGNLDAIVPPGNYYEGSIEFLCELLKGFLAAKGIEGVLRDRTAAILAGPRDVLAPYLAWFPGQKPEPPSDGRGLKVCSEVPPFVAEIFVEETALGALRTGFCALERLGVQEYWAIDARERQRGAHQFFRREGDRLVPAAADERRIVSRVFPGFWIFREWLDRAPSAPPSVHVGQILDNPPS